MADTPQTEPTPDGEQVLMPGITPITLQDQLLLRMAAPMAPKRNPGAAQQPCDIGLFDLDRRDHCDLLDFLRANDPGALIPDQPKED